MTVLNTLLLLLAVFAIGAMSTGSPSTVFQCPEGQTLRGARCIAVYRPAARCTRDFSFSKANAFCQASGGSLVSIHNQTEADFITSLIKKDQKAKQKACTSTCSDKPNKSCACANANKDYFYWIGLQLSHAINGSVNGSSWTDGTPVNYGNPQSASFRPPFVTGRPIGSKGDGQRPNEVCPDGNQNNCVQIYGFGPAVGRWRDQNCNTTHVIEQSCSCNGTTSSNSTVSEHSHKRKKSSSSSSEEEEDIQVDECRDEAALNGFICQYCPDGWTMFQNKCYKAIMSNMNPTQANAACSSAGANVVSIHSAEENVFVANLAQQGSSTAGSYFIGILLVHPNNVFNAPVTSASWSDGTPADYGNPSVAPWNTFGTYPWAPTQGLLVYPAQPDNRPPPGDCVLAWLPPSSHPLGTWDDITCSQMTTNGVVCKV